MKILYITNGDGYAGASYALENIIACLEDRCDIEVVFPRKRGEFSASLEKKGIKCHHFRYCMYVCTKKGSMIYRWMKNAYTVLIDIYGTYKLLKVVKTFRPDIIHTNVGPIDIGYRVAKKRKIPHVWHLREYINKDFDMNPIPSFNHYIRKYADNINTCITITDGVKKHFGLNKNALTIYDGPLKGKPINDPQKGNYFLFVGRLQEAKGDISLLQAFVQYVERGGKFNLWYAGVASKERMKKLEEIVTRHNIEDRVIFLGFRDDVNILMSKAQALFVPSRFEGFGFITAEAMYNHCLVVGRNTAGTKEQFDKGLEITGREIGVRFNQNSEMVDRMFDVEYTDYSELCNRAYQVVSTMYKAEINASKIEALYKSILKSNSK